MSKILYMQLSNKNTKPIFKTMTPSDKQINCMLDTGADMPVWCGSKGLLKVVFPQAELVNKKFLLSGFGRNPEVVDIYRIPIFLVKNEEGFLTFQNLYMASSFGRNFGCDLILSATMFKHMDYAILNRDRNTPVLEIVYDRDVYYTQLISNEKYANIIDRICSFASDKIEDTKDTVADFRDMYINKTKLEN